MFKSNRTLILFLILLIVLSCSLTYFYYSIFAYKSPTQTLLYFPPKTSTLTIAMHLEKFKVINNVKVFIGLAKILKLNGKTIKSGEYDFAIGANMFESLQKMIEGKRNIRKITFPEGLTNYQMDKIFDNHSGIMGNASIDDYKEGTLMPNTYFYYFGDDKKSILNRMAQLTKNLLESNSYTDNSLFKDDNVLLTLASIVEKEAKLPDEMPIIASVYINRLKANMPLQADPTVIYAVSDKKGELDHLLTKEDLKFDSPFNTYKYIGLPPHPIASSSKNAIEACLNPADTNYYYFVSNNEGGHLFAHSLNEHNKNVAEYRSKIKSNL